jgi:hypothetical protein
MHCLGYVIVNEPTEHAVEMAMAPFYNNNWDWYRCGGRWDGYLQGPDEEKRRKTHDGFNFDECNDSVERNSCNVSNLPGREAPYFFIANGAWIEKETFDGRAFVKTNNYDRMLDDALAANPDSYVVVVDVHS